MSAVEKRNILGVLIDDASLETATGIVIEAAHRGGAFALSAMAVHGVMEGVLDPAHLYRLNHLELVVADGQPVRWALNHLHDVGLRQPPQWMQDRGLEWLFRLCTEPRRLWRRYLLLSPAYIFLIACQWLGFRFHSNGTPPTSEILYG